MNYAERCRAEAAYYRRKDETCAKSHARLIALLDAAAGLWELNDPVSKDSPCKCGICTAMRAADAAAREAE